jgi:hypothetical protein
MPKATNSKNYKMKKNNLQDRITKLNTLIDLHGKAINLTEELRKSKNHSNPHQQSQAESAVDILTNDAEYEDYKHLIPNELQYQSNVDAFNPTIQDLTDRFAALNTDLTSLQQELTTVQSSIVTKSSEIASITLELKTLQKTLEETNKHYEKSYTLIIETFSHDQKISSKSLAELDSQSKLALINTAIDNNYDLGKLKPLFTDLNDITSLISNDATKEWIAYEIIKHDLITSDTKNYEDVKTIYDNIGFLHSIIFWVKDFYYNLFMGSAEYIVETAETSETYSPTVDSATTKSGDTSDIE